MTVESLQGNVFPLLLLSVSQVSAYLVPILYLFQRKGDVQRGTSENTGDSRLEFSSSLVLSDDTDIRRDGWSLVFSCSLCLKASQT